MAKFEIGERVTCNENDYFGDKTKYTGTVTALPTSVGTMYEISVDPHTTLYRFETEMQAAGLESGKALMAKGMDVIITFDPKDGPPKVTEHQIRKNQPVVSGCLDYFPAALLAVAELSRIGNDQHNPGQPMHWARAKSGDEADACVRHLLERGTMDSDGVRHSTKAAWRALANLQKELEAAGAPVARAAK